MKIALLQILPTGSLNGNREKGVEACRKAKVLGADIALFPEMWSNGYDIPEDAEALIALLNRNHPPKNIINACYEPMTGAHVGPGALALFFYGKKEFRPATK